MRASNDSDFPFADTQAAMLLRSALDRAHHERRLSIRALGKQLGYKQATVLSHMASGRVAIPLERAPEIARAVDIAPSIFLTACIAQRAPEAAELLKTSMHSDVTMTTSLATELKLIADRPLEDLTDEQKAVLREVVRDPSPARRWLSLAELPIITLMRQRRPRMTADGLGSADREAIDAALRAE